MGLARFGGEEVGQTVAGPWSAAAGEAQAAGQRVNDAGERCGMTRWLTRSTRARDLALVVLLAQEQGQAEAGLGAGELRELRRGLGRQNGRIREVLTMRSRFPALGALDGSMNSNGRRSLNLSRPWRRAGVRRRKQGGVEHQIRSRGTGGGRIHRGRRHLTIWLQRGASRGAMVGPWRERTEREMRTE